MSLLSSFLNRGDWACILLPVESDLSFRRLHPRRIPPTRSTSSACARARASVVFLRLIRYLHRRESRPRARAGADKFSQPHISPPRACVLARACTRACLRACARAGVCMLARDAHGAGRRGGARAHSRGAPPQLLGVERQIEYNYYNNYYGAQLERRTARTPRRRAT